MEFYHQERTASDSQRHTRSMPYVASRQEPFLYSLPPNLPVRWIGAVKPAERVAGPSARAARVHHSTVEGVVWTSPSISKLTVVDYSG